MAMDEMYEVSDFDEDINRRKELIEEAKQLDTSKEWHEIASEVSSLQKRWRRVYYWESVYEDELAEEFDAIIDSFYAKRKEGFQNIENAKKEMIARAKEISTSDAWNQTTEEMNELMKQWKAAGSAGKDVDDALWEEFNAARNTFFDRKRQNWEDRQAKAVNSREVKEDLIKQAAALSDSNEWKKTGDQMKELMNQWKEAGFSGKEVDDQLWEQFNAARQKFYDRRNEAYEQIRAQHEEHAAKKRELIAQAVAIEAKKEYNRENTNQMKNLNVLWKEAGFSGKDVEDKLWKEFRAAADLYFEGLKNFNDQRHADWVSRMQTARDRKMNMIQTQQRQLKWMRSELPTILSQSAAADMEEDIKDKEAFIKELEADLAEINEKLTTGNN